MQPYAVLTPDDFRMVFPDQSVLRPPSRSYFRVLWMAAEKGRAMYGDIWKQLFAIWSVYAVYGNGKRLRSLNCWAAALLVCLRRRSGEEVDEAQIASAFHCGTRAMRYRARMIEFVLRRDTKTP